MNKLDEVCLLLDDAALSLDTPDTARASLAAIEAAIAVLNVKGGIENANFVTSTTNVAKNQIQQDTSIKTLAPQDNMVAA